MKNLAVIVTVGLLLGLSGAARADLLAYDDFSTSALAPDDPEGDDDDLYLTGSRMLNQDINRAGFTGAWFQDFYLPCDVQATGLSYAGLPTSASGRIAAHAENYNKRTLTTTVANHINVDSSTTYVSLLMELTQVPSGSGGSRFLLEAYGSSKNIGLGVADSGKFSMSFGDCPPPSLMATLVPRTRLRSWS